MRQSRDPSLFYQLSAISKSFSARIAADQQVAL